MNRKGKKELLNNWHNMSIEERENKLAELESSLSEKKFRKIVNSIQKIENSLKDDSVSDFESSEVELENPTNENYEEENKEEEYENNFSNEESIIEDNSFEASDNENLESDFLFEEKILNDDTSISNVEDEELNQNWVIDENELNIENNFDDKIELDDQIFESEVSEEYVPVDFNAIKMNSKKDQIGSNERAWNKNKDIIYSQEELIYRLSNSTNINDEEYKMLLISAQKKIEFIQLLIEKSRVKNAAYSYDFLNSMCWRVDKALKTFLAANKR
ncbi:MAG: hypothetical protein ACRC8C_02070 [Mycoplasmoidaceae bacterium]